MAGMTDATALAGAGHGAATDGGSSPDGPPAGGVQPADRRAELLAAVMAHLVDHGVGDLSLRSLATAVGTSHRMLIYHFGSKEQLLVEVVQAVEGAQQVLAVDLMADESLTHEERMRAMWRQVSQPELAPYARLFFELYARALQGDPAFAPLLDGEMARWIEPIAADNRRRSGTPLRLGRADARLGVAVTRGLLLDLLATGDRTSVDRAFERFVQMWTAAGPPVDG
jgi:AcrR family transcriptional regulator